MPYQAKQPLQTEPKEPETFDVWYLFDLHHNVNTDNMNAFITGTYKLGRLDINGKFISYRDENGQELIRSITKNQFFEFVKEHAINGNLQPKLLMDGIAQCVGQIADSEGLFNLE